MNEQIGAIQEVLAHPQHVSWLPWAVQYFFFIGIAACAALAACWQCWRGHKRDVRLEMLAVFIALTSGITAPVALTADLHQTARVWHFYAYPTPWSWMPWGAVLLPLFSGLIVLYFGALLIRQIWHKNLSVTRWLAVGSALTAVGLLLYTGREASILRARPLWFSYWFPLLMLFSAMQMIPALLRVALHDFPAYQRALAAWQTISLLLFALCLAGWAGGDTLSANALRAHLHLSVAGRAGALAIVALWLANLLFSLMNLRKIFIPPVLLVQVVLSLLLAWCWRWLLLIQGQTIPRYNALYNYYHLSWGTDGVQAIAGTFCLWIALMIMVREGVRWLTKRLQHGGY